MLEIGYQTPAWARERILAHVAWIHGSDVYARGRAEKASRVASFDGFGLVSSLKLTERGAGERLQELDFGGRSTSGNAEPVAVLAHEDERPQRILEEASLRLVAATRTLELVGREGTLRWDSAQELWRGDDVEAHELMLLSKPMAERFEAILARGVPRTFSLSRPSALGR